MNFNSILLLANDVLWWNHRIPVVTLYIWNLNYGTSMNQCYFDCYMVTNDPDVKNTTIRYCNPIVFDSIKPFEKLMHKYNWNWVWLFKFRDRLHHTQHFLNLNIDILLCCQIDIVTVIVGGCAHLNFDLRILISFLTFKNNTTAFNVCFTL